MIFNELCTVEVEPVKIAAVKNLSRFEISTEPTFYEPRLLAVKISESRNLSIQLYAGSKFHVINTIYISP